MRMTYRKPIAAAFALMICAGTSAMGQLPQTGRPDHYWQEPAKMQVVELERTGSDKYSYLIFNFEAKTITLVKVDLRGGYGVNPIEVITKRMD